MAECGREGWKGTRDCKEVWATFGSDGHVHDLDYGFIRVHKLKLLLCTLKICSFLCVNYDSPTLLKSLIWGRLGGAVG